MGQLAGPHFASPVRIKLMSTVKLALNRMTVPEKVQFARRVADAIEANIDTFPDVPTDFDELRDDAYNLETAYNNAAVARAQAKQLTSEMAGFDAYLSQGLMLDARYVQNVSGGNDQVIALAGMTVSAAPQPVGLLPAPKGLTAARGEFAGQVALKWTRVPKARTYTIQRTANLGSTAAWQSAGHTTKPQLIVNGLASETKYWFRVAAINTAGPSPWSEVAATVAP